MADLLENQLEKSLDWIIHQLEKGNTLENLKNNIFYFEFEQAKEWKSKYGFQFQIYSNDHFIDNKPHFHLVKTSSDINRRLFFDGTIYDCKGKGALDNRTKDAVEYFLSEVKNQDRLKELWNIKNPSLKI